MNQRHCPICKTPAFRGCHHLALAAEGREFVRRCVELSNGQIPWRTLCHQRKTGERHTEPEDFTWLETAFCDKFLKHLVWFNGMDHEWRTGPRPDQGGFWVLVWSRDPQQMWWELREEFERKCARAPVGAEPSPWLIWLTPR